MAPSVTVLLALFSTAAAAGLECPDSSWKKYGGKCYAPGFPVPWDSLSENCRQMNANAIPASVHGLQENALLTTMLDGAEAWLGLNRTHAYSFSWVDGTPVDFQYWDDGQPDASGDCVFLDSNRATGQWAVASCSLPKRSVCQLNATPPPTPSPCPEGWSHHSDSCYWQSSEQVVYADVKTKCQDQHPDATGPISVHTSQLNSFLASQRPNGTLVPWLGLTRDSDSASDWTWADGTDVDYTAWYPDMPRDDDNCTYLGILYTQQWGSSWCDSELRFWCQLQL